MTSGNKSRILILDDDPMILSAFERLLRREFELNLVANLDSAREAIANQTFAVALVDLHLGSTLSLDFFRELQLKSPTTVRVLMSGALNLESLVNSLQANLIHKVLQKPWEPSLFILQLNEALQTHLLLKENQHLEQLSTTDAMTGLANYRYLQSALPKEVQRAKRNHRPFSFIMIDVDGFKDWNDSRGHLTGDDVIRTIGRLIQESLRSFDGLCRYGGDEFCVLLQETELSTALEIAERIRKNVETNSPLTISLGISSHPITSLDETRLLADADAALYSAKKAGRNRCSIAAVLSGR